MNIVKVDLSKLHNEELFQFMTDFKQLAEEAGVSGHIESLFAQFLVHFENMDKAMEFIRKDMHTKAITHTDRLRDELLSGFTLFVKAYLYRTNEAMVAAAERLTVILNSYGSIRDRPYNEETAAITNFLGDVESRCAGDVELLGAQSWLDDLRRYNDEFTQLMTVRFDEKAAQEYVNMRTTRNEIEGIYGRMAELITASALVTGVEVYTGFINRWNIRVAYYKNTLAQRKGRNQSQKVKKAADDGK